MIHTSHIQILTINNEIIHSKQSFSADCYLQILKTNKNEQQGLEFLVVYQSEVNLPWVPLCTNQLHKTLFGFVLLYPSHFKKEYERCYSSAHFKAESDHHLISHS